MARGSTFARRARLPGLHQNPIPRQRGKEAGIGARPDEGPVAAGALACTTPVQLRGLVVALRRRARPTLDRQRRRVEAVPNVRL